MKNVVIVGGGAAGTLCACLLQNDYDVTLVDKKGYFEFVPSIYKLIKHPECAPDIVTDFGELLPDAQICKASVMDVGDGLIFAGRELEYDYLVLSTGSAPSPAFELESVISPYDVRSIISNIDRIRSSTKHLVIGGGPVGVEMMGELCDIGGNEVSMVHGGTRILGRMEEGTSSYVRSHLEKKGAKFHLEKRVKAFKDGSFILGGGEGLYADIAYNCTGFAPETAYLGGGFALDEGGKVIVNGHLQTAGKDNIFAAGDITSTDEEKTYVAAERQAKVVAYNIRALDRGHPLREYVPRGLPMIIGVGGGRAVLSYKKFHIGGRIFGILKGFEDDYTRFKLRRPHMARILPI